MTRSRAAITVVGDKVTQEDMDMVDKAALDTSANNDGILIEKQRLYFEIDNKKQTCHPLGMKSKVLMSVWEIERVRGARVLIPILRHLEHNCFSPPNLEMCVRH